ncbi:MAG: restriction endonuclease subunit S [Kiritimatiellia bacterium]
MSPPVAIKAVPRPDFQALEKTSAGSSRHWKMAKLGDVAKTSSGGTPNRGNASYYGGNISWVKSGELGDSTVYETAETITEAGLKNSSAKLFPKGTLCIALYGATIGKLGVLGMDAATNQAVCGIFLPENIDTYFAYFFLESKRRDLVEMGKGGAQPNISQGIIRDLEIPLPPLPEQRRIVAEIEKQFSRLEEGVGALKRVQANLKRYRAAVLKAACEGKLVPGRGDWPTTKLGEICTVLAGYGFPERLQGKRTGDLGFFKVGDISAAWQRNQKVLTQANHYISLAEAAELRANPLPTGTVVFAKIGAAIALNRRAIIGLPSLVDNNVMGLYPGKKIDSRFLFHFMCTQKLNDLARATTVPSIRKGDVEGISLKLPSLAEQALIVSDIERRLSVVEEIESAVETNLQRATRLRQSILQKAFEGKLLKHYSSQSKEGIA